MKNKSKGSKITEAKFGKLRRYVSLNLNRQKITILTHSNRDTVHRCPRLIRVRIAEHCEKKQNVGWVYKESFFPNSRGNHARTKSKRYRSSF